MVLVIGVEGQVVVGVGARPFPKLSGHNRSRIGFPTQLTDQTARSSTSCSATKVTSI